MEEIKVYQSEDGSLSLPVALKEDSIWLTQQQMAERPQITLACI